MRSLFACAALLLLLSCAHGQAPAIDSDGDGLSDHLEDALLLQFRPTLMISSDDCSVQPARFAPGIRVPTVLADDGTLYGQAHPYPTRPGEPRQIELHFYHLWRRDCGRLGHTLDTEHIAVLLEAGPATDAWHATYWYAAAHEDTVCDASQITRATTLNAITHGATVWISSGKHASFLNEELCHHGCGGDRCPRSTPLTAAPVINLGEASQPMHGAAWIAASQWPLKDKMIRSDFGAERIARLQRLPATDIAWANPAKRPTEVAILGGSSAVDGTLKAGHATGSALATTGRSTDTALIVSGKGTSGALSTATRKTGHALSRTVHGVKHALGGSDGETATAPR
ncbi:MAG: hypothetical protein ACRYF4_12000 [Janthinobacterium lividum]